MQKQIFKIALVQLIILNFILNVYGLSLAEEQTFSLANFKDAIYNRIAQTGARDTMPVRVWNGESCDQASIDRAKEIAVVVKSFQQNGKFADYGARVGTVSGWDLGFGSLHTYSIVEIYDAQGKTLYTIDADNYLGPIVVSDHGKVNWQSNDVRLVEDVKPQTKINAYIEGAKEVKPGEMVSLRAVLQNPPPYVTYPLYYEWREGGSNEVKETTASVAFFAPQEGNYHYNVTILYKDENTRQLTKLVRLEHNLKIAGNIDLSGKWQGRDVKGRFNGVFDLKVNGNAVSGVFVNDAGMNLPVKGQVSNEKMDLVITFGNAEVLNYYLGDMALAQAAGSMSARLIVNTENADNGNMEGLLYPFNLTYHEENGRIIITERYSGGNVSVKNPARSYVLTKIKL